MRPNFAAPRNVGAQEACCSGLMHLREGGEVEINFISA
jgi:hypothetical protein